MSYDLKTTEEVIEICKSVDLAEFGGSDLERLQAILERLDHIEWAAYNLVRVIKHSESIGLSKYEAIQYAKKATQALDTLESALKVVAIREALASLNQKEGES
jgi:uncharacterized damage-inducible protein DinB